MKRVSHRPYGRASSREYAPRGIFYCSIIALWTAVYLVVSPGKEITPENDVRVVRAPAVRTNLQFFRLPRIRDLLVFAAPSERALGSMRPPKRRCIRKATWIAFSLLALTAIASAQDPLEATATPETSIEVASATDDRTTTVSGLWNDAVNDG